MILRKLAFSLIVTGSALSLAQGADSAPVYAPTIRDLAFEKMLQDTIPLTPEQIIKLKHLQDASQRASAITPYIPPTPVSSTLSISLDPGNTPPVIRLASGFVSSVVFLDVTGQPWPIVEYSLGNSKDFDIQWDSSSNTLFIQSLSTYSGGNIAIKLQGLNSPIMLSLLSGQKMVDYRIDLQVNARGPQADEPLFSDNLPSKIDPIMMSVLDGLPPANAKELKIDNLAAQAWNVQGKIFLRTKLTVLSPAWTSVVSSPDGTHVYQLPRTSVILFAKQGEPISANLKEE